MLLASRPHKGRSLRVTLAAILIACALASCSTTPSAAVPWESARDAKSDLSLSITYALDSCQDFDRIEIAYSRSAVTVTLFVVSNHSTCTGLRFVRSVDVPLREALAGREVVDGARSR
jgi:hypothetical protein